MTLLVLKMQFYFCQVSKIISYAIGTIFQYSVFYLKQEIPSKSTHVQPYLQTKFKSL